MPRWKLWIDEGTTGRFDAFLNAYILDAEPSAAPVIITTTPVAPGFEKVLTFDDPSAMRRFAIGWSIAAAEQIEPAPEGRAGRSDRPPS